jgi:hypothetical protein
VVSTGAQTPGLPWVSTPADYATFNSNHTPDDTNDYFEWDAVIDETTPVEEWARG